MVADFSQLHEYAHYTEEIAVSKDVHRAISVDILVIKKSLSSGKVTLDDMFNLLRQLLFNIPLHSPKQKWPENRLQFLYDP